MTKPTRLTGMAVLVLTGSALLTNLSASAQTTDGQPQMPGQMMDHHNMPGPMTGQGGPHEMMGGSIPHTMNGQMMEQHGEGMMHGQMPQNMPGGMMGGDGKQQSWSTD